jgi:hypothetical protein
LRGYLEKYYDNVIEGVYFVDRNKKDVDRSTSNIEHVYNATVKRLRSGKIDEYNTVSKFGILAALLSEAIYRGDVIENPRVGEGNCPGIVRYDGFIQVTDVRSRTSALVKKYRPYWGDTRKNSRDYLYVIAVNEIVDYWTSAWKVSGQKVTKTCRVGSEIKHALKKPTVGWARQTAPKRHIT